MKPISTNGRTHQEVLALLDTLSSDDQDGRDGRSFGGVYHANKGVDGLAREATSRFLGKNGLYPNQYPSILTLEREVVAMALHHLGGEESSTGTFTSGGTESIILACLAARDDAHARLGDTNSVELVLPVTAHAAFHKAAHLLGMTLVPVDVADGGFTVSPLGIEAALTDRTALVVASAPSYAHGVMDPIEAIGELLKPLPCRFHVDACIGGFLLPYLRRLGDPIPPFDLSVPGVDSISMDLHKYAYCPKGASVVLFRERELRERQIFACARWPGYFVLNTSLQSSKSPAPLAACWAVLHHIGDDGYLALAEAVREVTQDIVGHIQNRDDLTLLGTPCMGLLALASDSLDVYALADALSRRGWYTQAQLGFANSPPNLHLQASAINRGQTQAFLNALQEAVEEVQDLPSFDPATLLGALGQGDDVGLDLNSVLANLGLTDGSLPSEMALINHLLQAIGPDMAEPLLRTFTANLYDPALAESS